MFCGVGPLKQPKQDQRSDSFKKQFEHVKLGQNTSIYRETQEKRAVKHISPTERTPAGANLVVTYGDQSASFKNSDGR